MTTTRPHASTRQRAPRRIWTPGTVALAVIMGLGILSTRVVVLNVSPSVPLGLYRLTALPPVVDRGLLVVLPTPPSMAAWHPWWVALLKPIAAVEDAVVCAEETGLWVDGVAYGPILSEAAGRPLPHLQGCQVVPRGMVFVASTAPRSLDGRYFGMTPISDLTAAAVPLLTWR